MYQSLWQNGSKSMIYWMVNILLTNIRSETIMLTSDLCDYGDAYIVKKGEIDHLPDKNASMVQKDVF